jgi:hypothetical protein
LRRKSSAYSEDCFGTEDARIKLKRLYPSLQQ